MKKLTITLKVDPATAIRNGHAQVGEATLTLDDEDLAQLTDEQRETLAKHVDGVRDYAGSLTNNAPPIGEASIETLTALLDRRAEYAAERMAEYESEVRKAIKGEMREHGGYKYCHVPYAIYNDCVSEELKAEYRAARERSEQDEKAAKEKAEADEARQRAEKQAQAAIERAEQEAQHEKELAAWLDYVSDTHPLLVERQKEGLAADKDIVRAVRQKAQKSWPAAAEHSVATLDLGWTSAETIDDVSFARLKKIRETAPEGATYEYLKLYTCGHANPCPCVYSYGVRVTWKVLGVTVRTLLALQDLPESKPADDYDY